MPSQADQQGQVLLVQLGGDVFIALDSLLVHSKNDPNKVRIKAMIHKVSKIIYS